MKLIRKIRKSLHRRQFLDIHIVDHCNLKCRCCAHFAPVAAPFFIARKDLEAQYQRIRPVFDQIFDSIHLLGGEPLLHPELPEILKLTRRYFQKEEIQIITNGILLASMPEEFWSCCREEKITIVITRYPISLPFEKILKKAKEEQVNCFTVAGGESFIHHYLDPDGRQDPALSRKKCRFGGTCVQLRNGRLYPCAQAAYANILNQAFHLEFEQKEEDGIEPEKITSGRSFRKWLRTPIPFCRYCSTQKEHWVSWERSRMEREEWI